MAIWGRLRMVQTVDQVAVLLGQLLLPQKPVYNLFFMKFHVLFKSTYSPDYPSFQQTATSIWNSILYWEITNEKSASDSEAPPKHASSDISPQLHSITAFSGAKNYLDSGFTTLNVHVGPMEGSTDAITCNQAGQAATAMSRNLAIEDT